MNRTELIDRLARAIAKREGFYVTQAQARASRLTFPTLAQRNANPGNVRQWKDAQNRPYPQHAGYVDFVAWAMAKDPTLSNDQMSEKALAEGWRVLKKLIGFYLDGRFTEGKSPSLQEMFAIYAPSSDKNDPAAYAQFVADELAVPSGKPLAEYIGT